MADECKCGCNAHAVDRETEAPATRERDGQEAERRIRELERRVEELERTPA